MQEIRLADATTPRRMYQSSQLGELFLIHIVNIALKWITLSIYHFWGKTRIREYLWSQQSFDGDHFEYTGRGLELFLGFLKSLIAIGSLAIFALIFLPAAGRLLDLLFTESG